VRGEVDGLDWFDPAEVAAIGRRVDPALLERSTALIESLAADGALLFTVLDRGYPANLRRGWQRPPFVLLRGRFLATDDRAVALSGARQASRAGLALARSFARDLARQGVTVAAPLDRGVGGATLDAATRAGGRAIAVLPGGINAPLDPELRGLAARVAGAGALVSATWPDTPHTGADPGAGDRLASSLALGTVMVDTGEGSAAGAWDLAERRARAFLSGDGPLFIPRPLANAGPMSGYARHPNVVVVSTATEITTALTTPTPPTIGLAAAG
jgi:predicted Rossmann fold nucleotide-binding protein DprA/Smf involved in DNA uptake